MRKLLFFTFVCLLMPSNALAAVNDIFTAKTEEGVEMTFQITIDTEEYKYCQVGGFIYNEMKIIPAIDKATTGKITIPQTVNGYTVESISYLAFMNCEGITEVVISEGVRGINMCAFRGCRNLAKVTIPNSVTAIDDMAFYGCNLTSVQIPDGCSIDIFAFANNKISVLDIPKSCSVGKCAFAYNDIKEINISQENPLYGEYADCNAVIKDNTLIVGCSKTVIPHGVTTIANGAFSCCSALTEITIPSTVTSIAHEQYKVNVIGNFVITLNETTTFPSAFYGCENLERVRCQGMEPPVISGKVFVIETYPEVIKIPYTLYVPTGCKDIYKNSAIGTSAVDIIEDETLDVLHDGDKFTYKTIDGTELKYEVVSTEKKECIVSKFVQSESTEIVIPAEARDYKVVGIGESAFWTCGMLTRISIPESVTYIKTNAFNGCSSLREVTIPESVTTIEGGVFSGCTNLQKVSLPSTLTSIGHGTFARCTSLTEVNIPKSVIRIEERAFSECNKLSQIDIPDGVLSIGSYAFYDCEELTEVTIPSKVVSIGSYAFWECKGLMKVTSLIKEPFVISGVFGSYSGEPSKTTLYVPFGTKAKYLEMPGWENFKEIVELEKEEEPEAPYRDGEMFTAEVGNGIELRFTVISAAERTCMLGIPNTLEGEYYPTAFADGSAGKGMGMASMVVAIEIPAKVDGYKVIEIAPQALEASNLTYVTIPTSVTKIGDMAFYSTRIIGLGIPASVTEIGEAILSSVNLRVIAVDGSNPVYDSRSNCNAIIETATNTLILGFEGTTIIEGIEAIGKSAFTWCSPDGGPLEIHIPKTVTQIVDNPFFYNQHTERITVAEDNPVYDSRNNCNAIINTVTGELVAGCKKTVIPDGVTRIGKQAFSGLSNTIESLTLPASVLSIGNQAFYKTSVNVALPPNLQVIEDYAFQQNFSIEELFIPATVTSIGINAFFLCSNLKKVTSMIMEPMPLGDHAFDMPGYVWTNAVLYVPDGTKAKYEVTEGWKNFKNIVEFDPTGIQGITTGMTDNISVYSLSGQRLTAPKKGINIVGGRKVIK